MFYYIKGRRPAVYFKKRKKTLHIIFKCSLDIHVCVGSSVLYFLLFVRMID